MSYEFLTTVVLAKDFPEHHLKVGDVGAVVEMYGNDAVEVEFVTGSGRTLAVLTLKDSLIRNIGEGDVLAVRQAS